MDILKASPPVTVSAISFMGVPLQTWVYLLTAIYTILQIYILVRDKLIRDKEKNE